MLEAGQERGRWRFCKAASRSERGEARAKVRAAKADPEAAGALYVHRRQKVHKWFAPDKLGAAERWLLSQVGRPWAKVNGEIRSRFDTRTVPGRHIVFDHLLPGRWESLDGWQVHRRYVFFVDRHGFLRVRRCRYDRRPPPIRAEIREWIGERRIGLRGAEAFWLIPVGDLDQGRYRQAARLDPGERERLATLNQAEREAFIL